MTQGTQNTPPQSVGHDDELAERSRLVEDAISRLQSQFANPWCFDMDKAPKDGTKFVLSIHGQSSPTLCSWCERVGAWDTDLGMAEVFESEFLHVAHPQTCWTPLPIAPPKMEG